MTEQAKEFIKKRYLSSEDEHRTKEQVDAVGQKYDKIVILVFKIARCEVYRIFHNHDETEKFKKWSI